MIAYGLACLLVCALSYFDKPARPFAFVILCGWVLGFSLGAISPEHGWRAWPLISAMSGWALFSFCRRAPEPRWIGVWVLAGVMLALDILYLGFRWQRIPIEVEYSQALDFGLTCQLLLIGFVGARNAWVGVWAWGRDHVPSGRGLVGQQTIGIPQKEAAE